MKQPCNQAVMRKSVRLESTNKVTIAMKLEERWNWRKKPSVVSEPLYSARLPESSGRWNPVLWCSGEPVRYPPWLWAAPVRQAAHTIGSDSISFVRISAKSFFLQFKNNQYPESHLATVKLASLLLLFQDNAKIFQHTVRIKCAYQVSFKHYQTTNLPFFQGRCHPFKAKSLTLLPPSLLIKRLCGSGEIWSLLCWIKSQTMEASTKPTWSTLWKPCLPWSLVLYTQIVLDQSLTWS